jgi:phospholipase D3/4
MIITCANAETYEKAKRDPEKYDLVRARMGGWTEFFVTMFPGTRRNTSAARLRPQKGAIMSELTPAAGACLVESIPVGLEDLRGTPGVQYTEDVLVRLTRAAQSSIDLTAMYWALLPNPTGNDEMGFTDLQFKAMGAAAGRDLYEALRNAADRGVTIRILQSPGFSGQKQESDKLREDFPNCVSIRSVDMGMWYGGSGIMHQKIWIFDARHLYLGSANMDWKSISLVKEMGVVVEDSPELAADAGKYFRTWWAFGAMEPASVEVFDPAVRIYRRVPPWSALVPPAQRTGSPLATAEFATNFNRENPLSLEINGERGDVFLTGCPDEVRGPGRTWDGEGLVHTIDDARLSICVSIMDFGPIGLYSRQSAGAPFVDKGPIPNDTPVWWPALFDALLSATLTRKVYVRLLVSKWAHTSGLIEPLLIALQKAAEAGRADGFMSSGQLEIKQFIIPGWDSTAGSHRKFPGHTRVNHTKYIVTDRRINIGTSNMTWDYFASTAGSSFNDNHPALVRALQAVFDRDWASSYARRLAG